MGWNYLSLTEICASGSKALICALFLLYHQFVVDSRVCVSNHLPGYFPYTGAQWSNLEGYVWNILLTNIKPKELTKHIDFILPKGPYRPCLRMADRALLAGYPRYALCPLWGISPSSNSCVFWYPVLQSSLMNSLEDQIWNLHVPSLPITCHDLT